jgi:hypothetical protein
VSTSGDKALGRRLFARRSSQYSRSMTAPPFARAWLRQRELGAVALQALEDAELRQLDLATALAQTEMLLSAVRLDDLPEERRISSGFVEQQRLFARARK